MSKLLLLLAVVCAALIAETAGAAEAPSRLRVEPTPSSAGRIVDARGREVLLRGVSETGLTAPARASDLSPTLPFDARDAALVRGLGFNLVRIAVSWSRIEPRPGKYDERYITRVQRRVELLAAHGVYAVIDLHQDAWGATLVAREGEVCAVGTTPALGWDGAPGWATLDDGAARCAGATREFSPAVRAAWSSFFQDRAANDGVGVQTRYLEMLEHVAQRFAATEALAGIDVMNEPGAMTPEQTRALGPFYTRAVKAIRSGERAGGGFAHPIILEPSVLWGLTWSAAPLDVRHDGNVVYSPHVFGTVDGQVPTKPLRNAEAEARALGAAAVLVGEWGGDPALAGDGEAGFFRAQQRRFDDSRVSAAFWTWKQSCGDPASILARRHSEPGWRPWSVFEMDCREGRNTVVGPDAALIADLQRGYVRAAPGRLAGTAWIDRVLRVQGTGARRTDAPVVAYYPGARRPMVAVSGTRRVAFERLGRAGWLIVVQPSGGDWRLQAYAEPS